MIKALNPKQEEGRRFTKITNDYSNFLYVKKYIKLFIHLPDSRVQKK
jgi:hypothetical protein